MKQAMKKILSFAIVLCIAFLGVITTPIIGAKAETKEIVFQFDGSTKSGHQDGSDMGPTYTKEVDGYTLELTGASKCYTKAQDAMGNGCIKLGTSSVVGKFSFTVAKDVVKVIIAVAGYKANTATINVNGVEQAITAKSDTGTYTDIEVGTSSNKTVNFTTVSGGVRAMVNKITYVVEVAEEAPELSTEIATALDGVNAQMSLSYKYTETFEAIAGGDFEKVTVAPADWSGTYLIVCEDEKVAFNGALETLDAVSNNINVTITDGKIETSEELNAATFTISANGNAYSIKSASGYNIGRDTNKNGLDSNKSTTYENELSFNADGTVNINSSSGTVLRYNAASNQNRFRYYTSGQTAIALYKQVEGGADKQVPVYVDSNFRIRCGVDASLTEIEGVDGYGIYVTTAAQEKYYLSTEAASWKVEDGVAYVVIELGDIIGDLTKMSTQFTVQAFVKVGEDNYISENANCAKTLSVIEMIEQYHGLGISEVEELYNYLVDKKFIKEA